MKLRHIQHSLPRMPNNITLLNIATLYEMVRCNLQAYRYCREFSNTRVTLFTYYFTDGFFVNNTSATQDFEVCKTTCDVTTRGESLFFRSSRSLQQKWIGWSSHKSHGISSFFFARVILFWPFYKNKSNFRLRPICWHFREKSFNLQRAVFCAGMRK